MPRVFSRTNDAVFLLAWGTIFFSKNIQSFTGIPSKVLFVVALVLVVVSGALYLSAIAKFVGRLRDRDRKDSSS
jgi:uncharacterized membrane protein YhaH (DUF805 family)